MLEEVSDLEAIYRAFVALGTVVHASDLAKQSARQVYDTPKAIRAALKKADGKEQRITDVGREILEYLGEDVEMV